MRCAVTGKRGVSGATDRERLGASTHCTQHVHTHTHTRYALSAAAIGSRVSERGGVSVL